MNADEAKAIPMAAIMKALRIKPVTKSGDDHIYVSPLIAVKNSKLIINGNQWQNTGDDTGGDTMGFVSRYLQEQGESHTDFDILRWIKNMTGFRRQVLAIPVDQAELYLADRNLRINSVQPVSSESLINYLSSKGIDPVFAKKHLMEISVRDKATRQSFSALGMVNEEGGYALFKPGYQNLAGRQAVTFIHSNISEPTKIYVFYDILDYLTILTVMKTFDLDGDSMILHAMTRLKEAGSYIENYGYSKAVTVLPNTIPGHKATQALATFFKGEEHLQHKPVNHVYAGFQTLNEWHRHNLNLSA